MPIPSKIPAVLPSPTLLPITPPNIVPARMPMLRALLAQGSSLAKVCLKVSVIEGLPVFGSTVAQPCKVKHKSNGVAMMRGDNLNR